MNKADRWLLPDGVEEVLPRQAAGLESLRRKLLDTYKSSGYELVSPPMVEYLESLSIGSGHDLSLKTFTLTDQLSGRLMGIRPDITPQVARLDAHTLKREGVSRLSYCGSVLHSVSTQLRGSREIDQVGIELFGASSIQADIEVVELMLKSLKIAQTQMNTLKLDLGHVGIYRCVAKMAGLNETQELELAGILQRKAQPELKAFIESCIGDKALAEFLIELSSLCGDVSVLAKAKMAFAKLGDAAADMQSALDDLQAVHDTIAKLFPEVDCYFDLGELRGYNYHTGLVFAVYQQGFSEPLAKGGRYDHIGESFGRARPATGFSADLRVLLNLAGKVSEMPKAIFAPVADDSEAVALSEKIDALRQSGEVVIKALGDELDKHAAESCDRTLVLVGNEWKIKNL